METHTHPEYLTRQELADLVQLLDQLFGQIQRWLQVLIAAIGLILLVLIYVAYRVGA